MVDKQGNEIAIGATVKSYDSLYTVESFMEKYNEKYVKGVGLVRTDGTTTVAVCRSHKFGGLICLTPKRITVQ